MKRFIVVCFSIMAVSLFAQTQPTGMFSVDYKLLIALHPKMANYDMVIERHLRSDLDFTNMEKLNDVNMKIASLSIDANRKAEKVMRDYDRVSAELAKIENRMSGNLLEFDQERKQFQGDNTQKSQLVKMTQLKAQLRGYDEQIVKIWDDVMNPLYLSRSQSRQIVESALAEIDLILEGLSRQMGGALIIDSDYQGVQFAPDRVTAAPVVGAPPLSIRLYQSLLNSTLIGDVPDVYKKDPELSMYASGMRKDIEDAFDRNVAMQISKSPLFGKTAGIRGRMVLAGGKNMDLTRQVVENLFKKYAVRADIANRILSQIK